jgi:hypothetical protein
MEMVKPTFMTALMLFVSLVEGVRTQYVSAQECAEAAAYFVTHSDQMSESQHLADFRLPPRTGAERHLRLGTGA